MKISSLSPGKQKYIKQESESDIFDSDVTQVTDTQEKFHKRKHNHTSKNEDCENITLEASQSLLKPRKKEKKKLQVQSESMLSGINGHTNSIPIDDSYNLSISDKTKRKNSDFSEEFDATTEPPVKRKRKESIDFLSHDFVNSTPKKEKKKKNKKLNISGDYGEQDNTAVLKKEKVPNSSSALDDSNNNRDNNINGFGSNKSGSQRKKKKRKDSLNESLNTLLDSYLTDKKASFSNSEDKSRVINIDLDSSHDNRDNNINGFGSNKSGSQRKKKKRKDSLNESLNTLLDSYLSDKASFSNSEDKSTVINIDLDSSDDNRAGKGNGFNSSKIREDSSLPIKKRKEKKLVNQITKPNGKYNSPLTLLDKYLDINLLDDETDHFSEAVTVDNTNQAPSEAFNNSIANENDSEAGVTRHKKKKKSKESIDINTENLNAERSSDKGSEIKTEFSKNTSSESSLSIAEELDPVINGTINKEERDKTKLKKIYRTSSESSLSVLDKEEHRKKKRRSKESVTIKEEKQISESINDTETKIKQLAQSKNTSSDVHLPSDSGISDSDMVVNKEKKKNGSLTDTSFTPENNTDSKNSSSSSNGIESSDDSDGEHDDPDKLELDKLKASLKNIAINVDFSVPALHQICNRASKPTPQQRDKISKLNLPIKNGKFTKAEDKQIRENWNNFIKMYNFPDKPIVFFSLDKKYIPPKEKQNFLFLLAENLNDRTPFSVFLRFKILMRQTKQGRFTKEEDEYIFRNLKEGNELTKIAEHLQRSFYSVEKRVKRIQEKHTRKIRWKPNNMAAFVKYLLKVTETSQDEIENLKNRHITSAEWRRLSKKLDKVPVRILKRAWLVNIHPALFIPYDSCDLREVKIKLINMFYENQEHEWKTVNWSKYRSYFDGLTNLRLYTLMKTLVQSKVSKETSSNLKKCIKHLRKCVDLLPRHVIHKVRYKDGEIINVGITK